MRRVTGIVASIVCIALSVGTTAQARAPRVLVFDFADDPDGRIREQVQNGLLRTHQVELVSRAELERGLQDHLGFRGPRLRLEVAKLVAPRLGITSMVTGSVSDALELATYDATGNLLESRRFALDRGVLSARDTQEASRGVLIASRILPPPLGMPLAAPAASEIQDAQEAAKRHRLEAVLLDRRARAVEWIEAERAAGAQREARIRQRMAAAARRYQDRMARRQVALEREQARSARREALAVERRNQVLRELDALRTGETAFSPARRMFSQTGAAASWLQADGSP